MVERIRIKRPSNNPKMVKGHKLAVGNRSPQVRLEKRFLTRQLILELAKIEDKKLRIAKSHRLVTKMVAKGIQGDMGAIKEIFDRVEGKAPQSIELTGANKGPVETITRAMTPAEAARAYAATLAQTSDEDEE